MKYLSYFSVFFILNIQYIITLEIETNKMGKEMLSKMDSIANDLKSKIKNKKKKFNGKFLSSEVNSYLTGIKNSNNMITTNESHLTNVNVKNDLNVEGNTIFNESIEVGDLKIEGVLQSSGNEIILNKDAFVKLNGSDLKYRVIDLVEIIPFMDFLKNLCASEPGKYDFSQCDFSKLLKKQQKYQN